MPDHLFPESTTYFHSYRPPNVDYSNRQGFVSQEASTVDYQPLLAPKKKGQATDALAPSQHAASLPCKPREEDGTKKVKIVYPTSSSGAVEFHSLSPDERSFFLKRVYRTSYDDYNEAVVHLTQRDSAMRQPFTQQDDRMLEVLNATKPNIAYYGFGLPNKCCVAWGTAQCRTLPEESRVYGWEKKEYPNPFPGYPEKMHPYIKTQELSPHYDGSFNFGYAGHQRHGLDYPDDVKLLLRKDFPQHVPRDLTTNEATLFHQTVPACENWHKPSK